MQKTSSFNNVRLNQIDSGNLKIRVNSRQGSAPINNALITLSYTGEPEKILEQINTNFSGNTESIELATPPLEYSMSPVEEQPYSEYTIKVTAQGFDPIVITGIDILPTVTAQQNVVMEPLEEETANNPIVIPPHTLYGDYPPKIPEAEIKPVNESGEIVLSRVVIPEYIVVHDGPPSDLQATDHYVKYKDYIKNVASSEIYATWSEPTIRANILAIMSFTLNRVYTEWYYCIYKFGINHKSSLRLIRYFILMFSFVMPILFTILLIITLLLAPSELFKISIQEGIDFFISSIFE